MGTYLGCEQVASFRSDTPNSAILYIVIQTIRLCPHQRKSCQGLLRCASTTLTLVSSRKSGCVLTATGFTCGRKDANVSWSHYFLVAASLSIMSEAFSCAKVLRTGGTSSVGLRACRQPSANFHAALQKFGYSACTLCLSHLPYSPYCPQWIPCT